MTKPSVVTVGPATSEEASPEPDAAAAISVKRCLVVRASENCKKSTSLRADGLSCAKKGNRSPVTAASHRLALPALRPPALLINPPD